jgi:hypothetical protein
VQLLVQACVQRHHVQIGLQNIGNISEIVEEGAEYLNTEEIQPLSDDESIELQ